MVARLDRLMDATTAKLTAPATAGMSAEQVDRVKRAQRLAGSHTPAPTNASNRTPAHHPPHQGETHTRGRGVRG
jgi:hypothetical protein